MKKNFYVLALILLTISSTASATVFRVNNGLTENITGRLFNEIQTAHDHFSVKNGDTLMIESSGKPYKALECTKRLIIIGPGYFLGDNNGVNSVVLGANVGGGIRFENGSQGSYLIGIEISNSGYYLSIHTQNIYVFRCNIQAGISLVESSGCKINGSYIGALTNSGYNNNSDLSVTNCVIQTVYSELPYTTFENNILVGKLSTWTISAGTFRNNILIERDAKVDIKSPNIQNNLAPNEQFGTANGNRAYEAADLFVGGTSSDGKYRIKAGSPYLTAGYGGTQPGIFGGAEPYTLSGVPPIPIIYELNVPGTGSASSGLQINVKIRGAN